MNNKITLLVVAAGQGRRVGGPLPKQYLPLQGQPILWHTLAALHNHPSINLIVPVIAPDGDDLWQKHLSERVKLLPKVATPVAGDRERQFSVYNGLKTLKLCDDAWVSIHDGARPLLDRSLLDRLFLARRDGDAWIIATQASDTVKQVNADNKIIETLDRSQIWLAQTPQLFRYGLIMRAHQQALAANFLGTDDASLVEWLGETVRVVPGNSDNIKITHPRDLELAEYIFQEKKR